jgi:hypothetical protein
VIGEGVAGVQELQNGSALALTTLSNRCSALWVPFLGGLTLDPFTGIKGLPRSISDATGLAAQAHRRVVRHYRLPEAWVHL